MKVKLLRASASVTVSIFLLQFTDMKSMYGPLEIRRKSNGDTLVTAHLRHLGLVERIITFRIKVVVFFCEHS